jgi:hypothetical protein
MLFSSNHSAELREECSIRINSEVQTVLPSFLLVFLIGAVSGPHQESVAHATFNAAITVASQHYSGSGHRGAVKTEYNSIPETTQDERR